MIFLHSELCIKITNFDFKLLEKKFLVEGLVLIQFSIYDFFNFLTDVFLFYKHIQIVIFFEYGNGIKNFLKNITINFQFFYTQTLIYDAHYNIFILLFVLYYLCYFSIYKIIQFPHFIIKYDLNLGHVNLLIFPDNEQIEISMR